MRNAKSRRGNQILAAAVGAAGVAGLASVGLAGVVYNDSASTRFNVNTTWNPIGLPGNSDTANIDSHTVSANSVGEVVAGTTVNISDTGILSLLARSSDDKQQDIEPGAVVNVNGGGTLDIYKGHTVALNQGNLVLNGGTLKMRHYLAYLQGHMTISGSSTLNFAINNSGIVTPIAHGSGKLTITGVADTRHVVGFGATSDWTGDLEIAANAGMFGGGGTGYLAKTIPANLHLGSGAAMQNYGYDLTGWNGLRKDVTGTGTLTDNNSNADWSVSGTGNMKPGATAGAAGTLTVAAASGTTSLTFNSNATYTADITGTGTGAYDQIVVKGTGSGVGNITITNGAKLVVNLFKPTVNTSLDVVIIDASGTATGSPFTGAGSSITWNIASGQGTWKDLQTSWNGPDLRVTGTFEVPEPSAAMLLAPGALMALRRKKRN